MAVKPIPEGYTTITPWIIGADTAGLMDYLTRAFGAEELSRLTDENGVIGHAEMRIGDAILMMFDSPPGWGPTPAFIRLYVEDADQTHRQAVEAGGTSVTQPTHLFFGDKVGRVRDPFGNLWWLQSRVEDVTGLSEEELYARMSDPKFAKAMDYVTGALAGEGQ